MLGFIGARSNRWSLRRTQQAALLDGGRRFPPSSLRQRWQLNTRADGVLNVIGWEVQIPTRCRVAIPSRKPPAAHDTAVDFARACVRYTPAVGSVARKWWRPSATPCIASVFSFSALWLPGRDVPLDG